MPSGKHWASFVYVNVAFAIYLCGVFYYSAINEIKSDWATYRCNPLYMPLADNVDENFVYCIQSMQTNFMGFILQPLTFITDSLSNMLGSFMEEVNVIRTMFNKIRTFMSTIVQSIFGVFLNLVIEFQRITIGIKDLTGKLIGTMVTFMYIMDGSIKTMNSTWNGPPGQLVKTLGKCFHPMTLIQLFDGTIKCMNEVRIGDRLQNGEWVEATMQLDNIQCPEKMYRIAHAGLHQSDIYVTGSHYIWNKYTNTYTQVCNYADARECPSVRPPYFCCMITRNHTIPIGTELFWDWEDHLLQN